eukprot:CAMPEP_0170580936 /NCGR_PEP_ID=MMETSP0224-20130122/6773_1 /TAXON_ID=285029 /ORGANISM="Togula jolla, Strain CCCM 725" /LENGTH=328 /DNA_ID=CAMNT_0010904041 /DNA_START=30 /DNA_END=1013 /DNA_ORIENTATION=+
MGGPGLAPENYYQALGLNVGASEEEIRKQYHNVVRTLHPDRRRPGGTNSEMLDRFHQVQAAWRCLSDPTRRMLYDMRNFGRSCSKDIGDIGTDITPQQAAKLVDLQKEQAARDVSNMEHVLEKILRRETATRGVIIREALYGDLRLRADRLEENLTSLKTILAEDLIGPLIDVKLPVQSLVEQHTIVLHGGACASKADLPGFYNPLPMDHDIELSLYVLYEFKGNLHEVIVGDRETLSLPFRKHAVPPGKAPRGPFSPANITLRRAPEKLGSSTVQSRQRNSASRALWQAVKEYRFDGLLLAERGWEEPTTREFIIMSVLAGMTLVFW